ncbi:MAG TPA: T9SS type A sorting domain-containing protein, partial [Paludibacter sp.]|nr:T9SS type A sorting domain-containing protein [Paludibacter sp.]
MKKLNFFFPTIMIFCLLFSTVKIIAINYLITFSGSGASSVVESVVVQNLTQGTSVVVPAGFNLRLTDTSTDIDLIYSDLSEMVVTPNPFTNHAMVTFFAKQACNTQIDVFGLDGKKILSAKKDLMTGNHKFGLDLPAGLYFIHIQGLGFSYTTKIISQAINTSKAAIIYNEIQPSKSSPQKVQAPLETSMLYAANDRIIYKGISGIYATIVADVPTEDKNINFEFVGCTDADGNNYPVTNVGGQIW